MADRRPQTFRRRRPGQPFASIQVHVTSLSSLVVRRALAATAGCALLLFAVYFLAIQTRPGQRFEDAVLRAAERAGGAEQTPAVRVLGTISGFSVLGLAAVVIAIGASRRRPLLAVLGTCVIAGSVLTTEVIQRSLLRPLLLESGRRREDQSFPSGHAAVAMAILCALVIVVPYRWRIPVLLFGSPWATGVGVATVSANWHRPSDALGSDLIVLGYTCLAIAVVGWRGSVRRATPPTTPGRLAGGLLTMAYAVAVLVAVVGMVAGSPYTAGRAIALAGSAVVPMMLLALLRHVDLTPAPPAPTEDASRLADGRLRQPRGRTQPGHPGSHRRP
jgi:membrane-associated phospholipid phosphatase